MCVTVFDIFVFDSGSYGVVRRVIDKNSGTQYAAKFLRFSDVTVRDELDAELSVMSQLDHTNIVQVGIMVVCGMQ